MAERSKVDHVEARRFADQVLRYPAPLDRSKVELLAQAYTQLVELVGDVFKDTRQRFKDAKQMTKEEANAAFEEWQGSMEKEFKEIADRFGVSENCAANIFYLRTRSRWSQESEDELIRMDKAGEGQPNINEWP